MLVEKIALVKKHFGVELIDYERSSTGILLSSGCGIGLALMDILPAFRWFCDIDQYRSKPIDWEAIAICLSTAKPKCFLLAGWFTIDKPEAFGRFRLGVIKTPCLNYEGGRDCLIEVIGLAK